ncbi:Crp/Fnr family transcriptional regulator [Epilithonimonas sp. UC225_85]|uniref:Crp/Fnr family transcriptional regulator n=1 Tax=Epilithonimonas sp. UC225_85 TaxID=3350167 RepID=UPI0036D356C8
MEIIRHYFETAFKIKMTNLDWQIFSSKLTRQEFPKNHILLKTGQTENYLSFVETGIIRFYIPKIENDLTFAFVFADGFASAYDSFLTRMPSEYECQTLTKTVLWRIDYKDLQVIYDETQIGNKVGRFASEDLFLKKFKRELSLLKETAEERYVKLFSEQPKLIKEIPLKQIASYIGVTPQTLSRIRRNMS